MTRMCSPTDSRERGYSGLHYLGLSLGGQYGLLDIHRGATDRAKRIVIPCVAERCSLPQLDIGTLEFEDTEGVATNENSILFDYDAIGVKARSVRGIQLVGGFAISVLIKM